MKKDVDHTTFRVLQTQKNLPAESRKAFPNIKFQKLRSNS